MVAAASAALVSCASGERSPTRQDAGDVGIAPAVDASQPDEQPPSIDVHAPSGEASDAPAERGADVNAPDASVEVAPDRQVAWLDNPASHVDTTIGTTSGGNTFPGADFPFGMIQWSPDTSPDRPSGGGYDYKDSALIGFSLTHLSGPGCSGALGDVPILPLTGALPQGDLNAVKQPFSHTGEIATAGYYSVNVGSPAIRTELTATLHSAMARFTFPSTNAADLLFKLKDSANGDYGAATAAIVGDREVTGSMSSGGFCGTGSPYVLSFDIVFDQPFKASQILPEAGKTTPGFVFVTFDATKTAVVQAKVGISFVSVDNARGNWTKENPASSWDFDGVKAAAVAKWNALLGKVQIAGGTSSEQQLFYSSLYHSLLHPNVASDTNGQYTGFDNKVHQLAAPQHEQYVNYSGWDIYHSQVQLSALLAPTEMSDSAQSMLNDAAQNHGMLPKWSLEHGENGIMVGDPSDGILAGYFAFGATGFDTATALSVMIAEATTPNQIRPGLSDYETLGYVPDDGGYDQAGGITLEYIQADFALSQFAQAVGDAKTAASMLARAQSWQNLFDASVNMFIPKRRDGTFAPGVGPSSSHGLTEGDASQYRWVIAFDRSAQLTAMGGPSVARPALSAFFTKLDDYQGPGALMTNEFELGVPYWNNHTGEPWKTQEVFNRIRTQLYHDAPKFMDGVDTNDDLGALSSALVWSMLGLYPEYSGSAILAINGPQFPDERIHLANGKLIDVHADGAGASSPYIQSLAIDGAPSQRTWLDPAVLSRGASLVFAMGNTANQGFGSDGADPLEAAGLASTSAFLFATPNPLNLAPGASADVTLNVVSARPDVAQTVSWTLSLPSGFSASAASGNVTLAAGARATTKITVTASGATGNALLVFKSKSSAGPSPPMYVLPCAVAR
jgi:predicted alpha-1,2-mannosidase